jgi:subfamily B ATP-binding cassette protein MsbA/ATP-binding cassette subfamily B protein AbcA/BmrA
MNEKNPISVRESLSKLFPYVVVHRLWLTLLVVSAILGGVMEVIYPFFLMELTDAATSGQSYQFQLLIYWAIFTMLMNVGVTYMRGQVSVRYEAYTIRDFRDRITAHIQKLPISYIQTLHSGDMVSRLNNDVEKIAGLLKRVHEFIQQPLVFILGFTFMAIISWKLLLATCILIPISAILFDKVIKPIQSDSQNEMEELARANAVTQDAIRGITILKAFNLQRPLAQKYQKIARKIEDAGLSIAKRSAISTALFLALRYIPQLVCPLYGGYLAFQGEITLGALLASMTLIWMVFLPVEKMLGWLREIREVAPAINRIFELLEHPVENASSQALEMVTKTSPVVMERVRFQYSAGEHVLDNFDLRVEEGQTIALVGPSGCGKSTVLALLCGFHRPQAGGIKIYGNDLFETNLAEARAKISLVSQDTYLFPTTIKENIAYGRLGASEDEIIAAAKAANAHDFIMGQSNGYETQAGEWGAKLSGGERQRIALARAILKDAPILLLDEPTSALDTQSEAIIQEVLERLMRGKPVIIVAHRLSTLRNADQILVLDQGQIRERGTHAELMGTDSLYRRLYLKQAELNKADPGLNMEPQYA